MKADTYIHSHREIDLTQIKVGRVAASRIQIDFGHDFTLYCDPIEESAALFDRIAADIRRLMPKEPPPWAEAGEQTDEKAKAKV